VPLVEPPVTRRVDWRTRLNKIGTLHNWLLFLRTTGGRACSLCSGGGRTRTTHPRLYLREVQGGVGEGKVSMRPVPGPLAQPLVLVPSK
jgi:hypothetical protein